MSKRFGLLLSSLTLLIIGMVIFISDQSIDISVLIKLLKIGTPACIVTYFLGILIAKVLARSCADTDILSNIEQQKFIEDLLIEPSQIASSHSFIEQSDDIVLNEIGFDDIDDSSDNSSNEQST